jgi:hypothetical protein
VISVFCRFPYRLIVPVIAFTSWIVPLIIAKSGDLSSKMWYKVVFCGRICRVYTLYTLQIVSDTKSPDLQESQEAEVKR